MKKRGIMGLPITEPSLTEYQEFIKEMKRLEYDLEDSIILYTRHTHFHGEPCVICGATKIVHGMGRYIIFDCEQEKIGTPICGFCVDWLEKKWKIGFDYG